MSSYGRNGVDETVGVNETVGDSGIGSGFRIGDSI